MITIQEFFEKVISKLDASVNSEIGAYRINKEGETYSFLSNDNKEYKVHFYPPNYKDENPKKSDEYLRSRIFIERGTNKIQYLIKDSNYTSINKEVVVRFDGTLGGVKGNKGHKPQKDVKQRIRNDESFNDDLIILKIDDIDNINVSNVVSDLIRWVDALGRIKEEYKKENINQNTNSKQNNMPTKPNLNTILYGPPGTGKTYNTVNMALEIIDKEKFNQIKTGDRAALMKLFNEYKDNGQIVFTTFHQNYTYEDFMIGIKPNISGTGGGLSFKSHKGVFYDIAEEAKRNYEDSLKDQQTISKEKWVKEKFEDFKEFIVDEIETKGKFALTNSVSIYSVEEDVFIYTGEKENGDLWKNQRIGMHYDALINIYLADVKSRKDIKNLVNVPSLEKQHATYSFELIEKFRDYLNQNNYKFEAKDIKQDLKNYVLIIDEINRANISKVFGELITLLEDDKRIGAENELMITLPNGEKFGVPPNLYVFGTMNTADKSIALIDIALRRRFHFEGKYPDSSLISDSVKKDFLIKVNEAIYDKKKLADWLIGHAYFMKDEDLDTIIMNRIIPLLMEYFGNKTEEVQKILESTESPYKFNEATFVWEKGAKQETIKNGTE